MKQLYLLVIGLAALAIGAVIFLIATTFQGTLGVLSIVFLVLGVLGTGAFVGLNYAEVLKAIQGRSAYEGFNMFFGIAVALVLTVVLYMLFDRRNVTLDYTEIQKFTLAPYTYNLLENLDEDIQLQYILNPVMIAQNTQAEDLMRLYSDFSDRVAYEIIDPEKEPQKINDIAPVTMGSIYVRRGELNEKVSPINENNLTNAILKINQGEQEVVYFTTGHGEPSIEDTQNGEAIGLMAGMLTDEGYDVQSIALFEMDSVPEDAAAIVIAGPRRPFIETELATLKQFMNEGGDVILFIDPLPLGQSIASGLEEFLFTNYGILLGENWVIENNPLAQMFGGEPQAPMISMVEPHPITDAFAGSAQAIFFPIVRSVQATESAPEGLEIVEIISTSAQSWGETDLADLAATGEVGNDAGIDLQGPVPIAVAASMEVESDVEVETAEEAEAEATEMEEAGAETLDTADEMRLVVFGDSDFITNNYYQRSFDLFVNSVNWLSQQEDMISIRPKDDSGEPIVLTTVQANTLFYIPIIVIPGLVAVLGAAVFFFRMRMT